MVAPKYFTWDYDPGSGRVATAGSLDDMGSALLQDHAQKPPKPPSMPYAVQLNQWALQLPGVDRVIGAAIVEVHFATGTPSIYAATGMSSILTTTWAQNNWIVTDNGVGDVTLTWPAGSLPPLRAKPFAYIVEDGAFLQPTAIPSGNSVRVKLRDNTGTAVDKHFCLHII